MRRSGRAAAGEASPRNRFAARLFAGIAGEYEAMGALLSLGQDPRWRRFLVSRAGVAPGARVLDVATGTGLVARELARRGARVVGLDQSEAMVAEAVRRARRAGFSGRLRFVLGRAERLPFPDGAFDAVTFTYLLRYVDDPEATVAELARVLRPGGRLVGLEFSVPEHAALRLGWLAYTRGVLPAVGLLVSPAWYRVGRFLGPSISAFHRSFPLPEQVRWWQAAGIRRVRTRPLSLGAALVTWGMKGGG
ncbi:MAG TPA: class I SAM-dependent methyltransferase [Actinomycetota bacterium]|nr:class I SAM-dependent methyltransferase [Actinomycetota bacterium]